MKKALIILAALLVMYRESLNSVHRVALQIYEGGSRSNDIYLIACNGYYMPLIADDLEPGDHVLYMGIDRAEYKY